MCINCVAVDFLFIQRLEFQEGSEKPAFAKTRIPDLLDIKISFLKYKIKNYEYPF